MSGPSAQRRVPLVVIEDGPAAFDDARRELATDGWRLVEGWSVADASPVAAQVRYGAVRDTAEAAAALLAAVAGHGVLIHGLAPRRVMDRLCDDLRRLGPLDHRIATGLSPGRSANPGRARELPHEQRALVELLASGKSLGEAANALHLSRRTADRRIAAARRALGARTTAELLARLHRD